MVNTLYTDQVGNFFRQLGLFSLASPCAFEFNCVESRLFQLEIIMNIKN